jgi:signal transduction histidine kinase
MRAPLHKRTIIEMTTKQMGASRSKLANALHEELGQHLAGTLLAAGALSSRLTRRRAPEATEASYLVEMLMNANNELACLIKHLDAGKLR